MDDAGSIHVTGSTESSDFPTQDALQDALNSPPYQFADAFVTRLSADGGSILYSTYFGGADDESPTDIAIGPGGEIVIAGTTQSTDLPLRYAYQTAHAGGGNDLFVTSISPGGGALEFSTYVGGSDVDQMNDVAVDATGRAHVVGYSFSTGFPPDGIEGAGSIVLRQLSADGSELGLAFTTFSTNANAGHGVAVGPDGDVYITGAIDYPSELYVARLSDGTVTDSPDPRLAGSGVKLLPNRPNPFNPTTELAFRLPAEMPARLTVHDARGRRQAVLADGVLPPGEHRIRWTPRGAASGVYYARLEAGGAVETGKLVLLK